MSNIPVKLQYTRSHEWVKSDPECLTVGITDHAQTMLGDLVYVELPELETVLESGEECAVVESVKAAADIYCPAPGEVIEINEAVIQNPQLVNEDPYGKGWLFKVRPHDKTLLGLLSSDEYIKVVASEAH